MKRSLLYRLVLTGAAVVLVLAACERGDSSGARKPADARIPVPTMMVVDGSGSMNTADAPGPRIDAAKAAATTLVEGLPGDAQLGLMTYGTSTGSAPSDKAAGCRDVRTLVPLGPLDRDRVKAAIAGIVASGYTPLSLALQQAVGQLPADDSPQAVVLVSDGEGTCDVSPCATARQLKAQRPGLTISTVGFRLDGGAADQLGCIAKATGGLFVTAENTEQLTARLKATQDLGRAKTALTGSGLAGIELGQHIDDIRKANPDFPSASSKGTVRVIWRDCQWTFTDGKLTEIAPQGGGRTIDGVGPGTPLSRATELYGKPVSVQTDGHGGYRVTYSAAPDSDAGYRMLVEDYSDSGGTISGTVKTVVLCTCKPHDGSGKGEPEIVVLKPVDAQGHIQPGWTQQVEERTTPIECDGPSPHEVGTGVWWCGGNADAGNACWPTHGGTHVLCLRKLFSDVLTLIPSEGDGTKYPNSAEPIPMGLVLDDGTKWFARIGGAAPMQQQHPYWILYYFYDGPGFTCVWGPPDGTGIDKTPDGWTVWVGPEDGALTSHRVMKAYYVGAA